MSPAKKVTKKRKKKKKSQLFKAVKLLTMAGIISLLAGCAAQANLNAPCPNFGSSCTKIPINSWNNASS